MIEVNCVPQKPRKGRSLKRSLLAFCLVFSFSPEMQAEALNEQQRSPLATTAPQVTTDKPSPKFTALTPASQAPHSALDRFRRQVKLQEIRMNAELQKFRLEQPMRQFRFLLSKVWEGLLILFIFFSLVGLWRQAATLWQKQQAEWPWPASIALPPALILSFNALHQLIYLKNFAEVNAALATLNLPLQILGLGLYSCWLLLVMDVIRTSRYQQSLQGRFWFSWIQFRLKYLKHLSPQALIARYHWAERALKNTHMLPEFPPKYSRMLIVLNEIELLCELSQREALSEVVSEAERLLTKQRYLETPYRWLLVLHRNSALQQQGAPSISHSEWAQALQEGISQYLQEPKAHLLSQLLLSWEEYAQDCLKAPEFSPRQFEEGLKLNFNLLALETSASKAFPDQRTQFQTAFAHLRQQPSQWVEQLFDFYEAQGDAASGYALGLEVPKSLTPSLLVRHARFCLQSQHFEAGLESLCHLPLEAYSAETYLLQAALSCQQGACEEGWQDLNQAQRQDPSSSQKALHMPGLELYHWRISAGMLDSRIRAQSAADGNKRPC